MIHIFDEIRRMQEMDTLFSDFGVQYLLRTGRAKRKVDKRQYKNNITLQVLLAENKSTKKCQKNWHHSTVCILFLSR